MRATDLGPLVRNRGTVCGSLHADPQGDWGADARRARVSSPEGRRRADDLDDDLADGPFTTILSADEVITEARVPDPSARSSGTYVKLERKAGTTQLPPSCTGDTRQRQRPERSASRSRASWGRPISGPPPPKTRSAGRAQRGCDCGCCQLARSSAAAIGHSGHGRLQAQCRPSLHGAGSTDRSRGHRPERRR